MRVSVALGVALVAAATVFDWGGASAARKTLAETCGRNYASLAFCGCARDWCEDRCRGVYETSSRLAACYGRCKQSHDDCVLVNSAQTAPGGDPSPPVPPKGPTGIITTPPTTVAPGN
jgi:hypothetical protein